LWREDGEGWVCVYVARALCGRRLWGNQVGAVGASCGRSVLQSAQAPGGFPPGSCPLPRHTSCGTFNPPPLPQAPPLCTTSCTCGTWIRTRSSPGPVSMKRITTVRHSSPLIATPHAPLSSHVPRPSTTSCHPPSISHLPPPPWLRPLCIRAVVYQRARAGEPDRSNSTVPNACLVVAEGSTIPGLTIGLGSGRACFLGLCVQAQCPLPAASPPLSHRPSPCMAECLRAVALSQHSLLRIAPVCCVLPLAQCTPTAA
jgi:hypothetical protein